MDTKRKGLFSGSWLLVLLVSLLAAPLKAGASEEPVLVGHIAHIEGKLFRYVSPDEATEPDWVLIRKDAPLGSSDIFYSDRKSRAEFMFPNSSLVRIGSSTQIEVVVIEDDLTELYVTAGMGRFFSKSATTVKAAVPFGYVVAPPETIFDLYVGEESMELTAIRGAVEFVHLGDGEEHSYEVSASSFTLRADNHSVETSEWYVDRDWKRWNRRRDALWAKRAKARSEHLPPALGTYAYVFDEYGAWERHYYDGAYRYLWRPTVAVGWSPFSHGRWTVWFGSHVWVPTEPFGYVTHHYGHWTRVGVTWYWAPPWRRVRVEPVINIHWHPGRVGWIHADVHIGWYPLRPFEIYYGHRRWDPHTHIITKKVVHRRKRPKHFKHCVVVKKADLYVVKKRGYSRIKKKRHFLKHASSIPGVNHKILKKTSHRFHYTDVKLKRKPHKEVVARINHRRAKVKRGIPTEAPNLQRKLKRVRRELPRERERRIKEPVVTNRIVAIPNVNKPNLDFERLKRRRGRPSVAKSTLRKGTKTRNPPEVVTTPEMKNRAKLKDRPQRMVDRDSGEETGTRKGSKPARQPDMRKEGKVREHPESASKPQVGKDAKINRRPPAIGRPDIREAIGVRKGPLPVKVPATRKKAKIRERSQPVSKAEIKEKIQSKERHQPVSKPDLSNEIRIRKGPKPVVEREVRKRAKITERPQTRNEPGIRTKTKTERRPQPTIKPGKSKKAQPRKPARPVIRPKTGKDTKVWKRPQPQVKSKPRTESKVRNQSQPAAKPETKKSTKKKRSDPKEEEKEAKEKRQQPN